eukprot:g27841.t1
MAMVDGPRNGCDTEFSIAFTPVISKQINFYLWSLGHFCQSRPRFDRFLASISSKDFGFDCFRRRLTNFSEPDGL